MKREVEPKKFIGPDGEIIETSLQMSRDELDQFLNDCLQDVDTVVAALVDELSTISMDYATISKVKRQFTRYQIQSAVSGLLTFPYLIGAALCDSFQEESRFSEARGLFYTWLVLGFCWMMVGTLNENLSNTSTALDLFVKLAPWAALPMITGLMGFVLYQERFQTNVKAEVLTDLNFEGDVGAQLDTLMKTKIDQAQKVFDLLLREERQLKSKVLSHRDLNRFGITETHRRKELLIEQQRNAAAELQESQQVLAKEQAQQHEREAAEQREREEEQMRAEIIKKHQSSH